MAFLVIISCSPLMISWDGFPVYSIILGTLTNRCVLNMMGLGKGNSFQSWLVCVSLDTIQVCVCTIIDMYTLFF